MTTRRRRRRRASVGRLALAAAVGAGAGAASNPEVRRQVRRLAAFVRPLGPPAAGTPEPPPLPPARTTVLAGRGEVFFREAGPQGATTVLLLHGWAVSADVNFFSLYGELSGAYHVVALDHRGHGRGIRSTELFTLEDCADDAAALLAELGCGPAVVVGYSMGGPIAMLLARRHPEQVAGLVVEATALEWQSRWYQRLVWRLLPFIELLVRLGSGDSYVERLMRQATDQDAGLDRYRPWLSAELRRGSAKDFVSAGRALSRYDARSWAAELDVPCAALVTTRDRLVPLAEQRRLVEALGAREFRLTGDHDSPLVNGFEYALLTRACIDWVASAKKVPAHSPSPQPVRALRAN